MSNEVISIYNKFSDHAVKVFALEGGFDSLITQYFNENDARKFKTNLNIAIATACNTQPDKIKDCMDSKILRVKVCASIMKIIQFGAVIDYRYIYFSKFGGKNPDAGFYLQYQAEISILEQNGFKNIEVDYVLKSETKNFDPIRINNELIIREHILDFEKRQNTAQDLIKEVACGYAIYSVNGVKKVSIIDNDILTTSYKMSNDRSTKADKENLKWSFKKAINISIIHSLFRHLVLKDWDSEEFDYQSNQIQAIKAIDEIVDIQDTDVSINKTEGDEIIQSEPQEMQMNF